MVATVTFWLMVEDPLKRKDGGGVQKTLRKRHPKAPGHEQADRRHKQQMCQRQEKMFGGVGTGEYRHEHERDAGDAAGTGHAVKDGAIRQARKR